MTQKSVALVTGVSSGIGGATAGLLVERGFRVFGTVRETSRIQGLSPSVELLRLDVRDDNSVSSGVRTVLDQAGRIDALVNNAGYALIGALEETSIAEAKDMFEANFFGVLRMCQAVLPLMRAQGSGRIVNIGSVLGFLPAPYMGIYAATKHAVEGYSESLDHEARGYGIHVSVIEPGFTRTHLGEKAQMASRLLEVYSRERGRASEAIRESMAHGEDPVTIASVVWDALSSPSPRLRYPAGREAKFLTRLKKFAPTKLLDKGLRKQFKLEAA